MHTYTPTCTSVCIRNVCILVKTCITDHITVHTKSMHPVERQLFRIISACIRNVCILLETCITDHITVHTKSMHPVKRQVFRIMSACMRNVCTPLKTCITDHITVHPKSMHSLRNHAKQLMLLVGCGSQFTEMMTVCYAPETTPPCHKKTIKRRHPHIFPQTVLSESVPENNAIRTYSRKQCHPNTLPKPCHPKTFLKTGPSEHVAEVNATRKHSRKQCDANTFPKTMLLEQCYFFLY